MEIVIMKTRRFTRKIILGMIFLGIVFCVCACTSMEAQRDKFMASGKELYLKADYIRARLQFKNALQIDPKYPDGYLWLGKTEFKLKNFQGAFGVLSKAVELKPDLVEAQILSGQILLMAGKLDEAEARADLALKKEPENPEALLLAASVAATQEQPQKALELVGKVIRLDPHKTNAYLLQALIQAKQKQPEAAAATLEEGLQANPKSLELYLTRARLADEQKQFEVAEFTFHKALALEPKNTQIQVELARHYIKAGKLDKAEQALRQTLALEPDKEGHALELARFLAERGQTKKGENVLTEFISQHPDNIKARFALADFYLSMRRFGKGIMILNGIVAADPSGPKGVEARDKLAALALTRGQLEEATKLVAGVLKDNPKDMGALRIQGQIALINKDGLKAVNNFRILTQDQPQNPETWILLARAHKLQGELEQAKEKAKKAIELKPDFLEARTFLYGLFLEAKDYDGAIQTIKGYLLFNDKDVFNLTSLGDVYVQKGDFAQAQNTFQKVVNLDPKKPQGYFSLGLLKRQQKQPDRSLKYFDQALAQQPDFLPALQQEVAIYVEEKQLGKAVEVVRQANGRNPKNPQVKQMLGELLLTQKQPEAAAKVLEEAVAQNPNPQNLRLLTVAYLQQPSQDLLMQRLEEQAADSQAPPYKLLILSKFYEQKKDFDKSMALYETMLTRDLMPVLTRNNLAYLLAEHYPTPENLERALKLSSEALEEDSDEPSLQDTMGWILCKRGEYAKARPFLEKAVVSPPDSPTRLYHLGWCEGKLGETAKAQEMLKKALALKSEFAERAEAQKLLESLAAGKP